MNSTLLAVSALTLLASVSFAQTITGTITGTVTDPTGSPVPGVRVTATNTATNVTTAADTNNSGVYNLLFLPVGQYRLSTEAKGFKASNINPFQLEVNQTARVDISLQIGEMTESINVSDVAPVLQTESASTGETISSNIATAVPLRSRNFVSLAFMVPGVITPNTGSLDSAAGRSFSGGRPYVNGNREQTNNFLLDGADVNESIDNLVGYAPNVDALQEVRVMTGNAGAEFGNANGAIINMTLKSGTNNFHGNVFEFFQNDNLNANGFINNRSGRARREFKRNTYGGTFGGPIIKDRAFFFVDYQGTRQQDAGPETASVPSAALRTGNLSGYSQQIIDPQTGRQFPGNIIPANRIVNPVAQALFANPSLFPLPNATGIGPLGITSNYRSSSATRGDNDQADAKVDLRFTERDNLMGRFSIARYREAPTRLALPTYIGSDRSAPTTGGVVAWTRTFTPTIVNEARFNFTRVRITDVPVDPAGLLGNAGNQTLGIPGGQGAPGVSEIRISNDGFNNIGSVGIGSDNITNTFQIGNNLTWQAGRHLIKLGGQGIRYQQNRFYSGNNGLLGFFLYDGRYTGSAYADFLLDLLAQKGQGSNTGLWGHRQWRTAVFIQDDFKATTNLTLNLGLRWEYNQPIYEVADRQLNVDIYTGQIRYAGQNGNSRALYNPYYAQYMPRLGFAWTPGFTNRRFVIRGGYGITSYLEGTGANLRLPMNPPFFFESDVQYSNTTPGNIRSGFADVRPGSTLSGQVRAWNPDLRPAFVQQYNFTLEYQLTSATSFSAGYVGQSGTHLVNPREGNQAQPGPGPIDPRRPLATVLPGVTSISYTDSSARMRYNSLQTQLRQRYASGLEFIAAYTLSKTQSDNLGYYGSASGSVAQQSAYWQNAYDRRADWGPAFFDALHNVTFSGSYEVPFGNKRRWGSSWNGVTNAILGGWNTGFFISAHSGFPITITSPNRANAGARTARANRYRPLTIVDQSIDRWFGTDPSAIPCGANVNNGTCAYGIQFDQQFGTAGVGTERAPSFWNVDFMIGKRFPISETNYFDFRAEFFNLPNSTSFGAPNRDASSAQFGFINSQANSPRAIQFALKYFF